jgi:transposase
MERIGMSQQERDWLDWLKRAGDKKKTQREAAEKMGVSERWVRQLLRRMKGEGDRVVVHGLRGRASNRKIAAGTRKKALEALADPDWHDFGPTFAAEQLAKRYKIEVSDETLRQWMKSAGFMEEPHKQAGRGALLASSPQRVRRTGAVGHLRPRLAGRTRAGALSGAADRRCYQLELGTLCPE